MTTPTTARSLTAAALTFLLLAPGVSSALLPYTALDREARQEPVLQEVRQNFDPGLDYATANEFGTNRQLVAMAAELAAQERGLSGTAVAFGVLDSHLHSLADRLRVVLDPANRCTVDPSPGCTTNIVVAWRSVFLVAYVLARHEELAWSQATKDAALGLLRDEHFDYKPLITLQNTVIPVVGARLLGGLALDDADLRAAGRTEFIYAFDEDVRRGLGEPLSPHYAGPTLSELALLIDGLGPDCTSSCTSADLNEIRRRAKDFMSLLLVIIGHQYLPGGGVGSPQERKGGGALTDKDPTDGDHLIQNLHTLLYDPALEDSEVNYIGRLAGIEYIPDEIVRSIFFEKGEGYTYWRRDRMAHLSQNGGDYPGLKGYPLGISGSYWDYFDIDFVQGRIPVNPVQVFMLPNGAGATGISYGAGGTNQISSGTYLRDPDGATQASDADLGFAILHHRQPKNGVPNAEPFDDPLVDDPLWMHERRTPHRRMMLGGTTITLFDTSQTPAGGEPPLFEYSQVHLPDFSNQAGAIQDSCDGWRVSGVQDKWWLGFRPLGTIDEELAMTGPHDPNPAKSGDEQGGPWTYLELSSAWSITGDITVLEPGDAYDVPETYATLELAKDAFCTDLADRSANFNPVQGWASVKAIDPDTQSTVTMKLVYEPEQRSIQPEGGGWVAQADEDFLDHGFVRSVWVNDPDSSVSFDDATFVLTVKRSGYPDLVLDFGPEGGAQDDLPTAPGVLETLWPGTNWTQTKFAWKYQPWDDGSIASYQIWRGEPDSGELLEDFHGTGNTKSYTDVHGGNGWARCALQIQNDPKEEVTYTVRSRDDSGNLSENHARILVPEDAQPPSKVSDLSAAPGGEAEIDLAWSAATDACGVYAYHILRDDGGSGPLESVATVLGGANTSWTDICRDPSLTYTYEVQAVDTAPNWGEGVQITGTAGAASLPAPQNLAAYPSSQSITLIWYSVGNPCVLRYEVERDDGQTQVILPTGYIWYEDQPPSGSYTYRVRMVSTWSEPGPWSDPVGPIVMP